MSRRRSLLAASMQGSGLTFPITLVEGVNDSEYVLKFFDWARNLPLTGYEINEKTHIFRNYALNNNNPDLGYPNDGFPLLYEDFRNVIRINIDEGEFYIDAIAKFIINEDYIGFQLISIYDVNTNGVLVTDFPNIVSISLYLNGNLTIERRSAPTPPVITPPVITPPVIPS